MKRLFLIRGLAGSGKTTLAKIIMAEYGSDFADMWAADEFVEADKKSKQRKN